MNKPLKTAIGLLLILVAAGTNAQKIGIKGAINMNMNSIKLDGKNPMTSSLVGWQAGAVVEYNFTERVEFNSGILFSKKGVSLPSSEGNTLMRLSYIELPINISVDFAIPNTKSTFFIETGPYISYALHGSYNGERVKFGKGNGQLKPYDIGIGGAVGWKFFRFKTAIGYEYGFINIANAPSDKIHNQLFNISLTYLVDLKE